MEEKEPAAQDLEMAAMAELRPGTLAGNEWLDHAQEYAALAELAAVFEPVGEALAAELVGGVPGEADMSFAAARVLLESYTW